MPVSCCCRCFDRACTGAAWTGRGWLRRGLARRRAQSLLSFFNAIDLCLFCAPGIITVPSNRYRLRLQRRVCVCDTCPRPSAPSNLSYCAACPLTCFQAFIASSLADVRRHLNTVNLPRNCQSSSALLEAERQLQVTCRAHRRQLNKPPQSSRRSPSSPFLHFLIRRLLCCRGLHCLPVTSC